MNREPGKIATSTNDRVNVRKFERTIRKNNPTIIYTVYLSLYFTFFYHSTKLLMSFFYVDLFSNSWKHRLDFFSRLNVASGRHVLFSYLEKYSRFVNMLQNFSYSTLLSSNRRFFIKLWINALILMINHMTYYNFYYLI